MNSAILGKQLQRLSDALSEFDDALVDAQMKSVPGPNMLDISRQRLLAEIDSDLSDISESVCGIGEKIEQLKIQGYFSGTTDNLENLKDFG